MSVITHQAREPEEPLAKFKCRHALLNINYLIYSGQPKRKNFPQYKVGDSHIQNCNICGAFFPKSGSTSIRDLKRHTELYKLYTSDFLRTLYSQCQQKTTKREQQIKISGTYLEVRNLIIDWLVEVSETLKLDIYKSAFHAVLLLDRFLTVNKIKHNKEMDQSMIMIQALCCLFIAAKNYEKDPHVPSSRRFLR